MAGEQAVPHESEGKPFFISLHLCLQFNSFRKTPTCKNIQVKDLVVPLIVRQERLELTSEMLVQNHRTSESAQIFFKFK